MQGFFTFLQQNPYLLLFFVVGLAVWIGRASIKGYGLGMVAGAIVVGATISVTASPRVTTAPPRWEGSSRLRTGTSTGPPSRAGRKRAGLKAWATWARPSSSPLAVG